MAEVEMRNRWHNPNQIRPEPLCRYNMRCKCGECIVHVRLGRWARWEHLGMNPRCEDGTEAMPVVSWVRKVA